jgi:N-acetylglucosamine-6-phosphate deacetylase
MTYFDLQVNGYAGIDFNQDDLTAEALHTACKLLEEHHVEGILATIITEDIDRMAKRLHNLATLREQDPLATRIIQGVHIEGPFISPEIGYVGAHPADAVIPGDVDAMKKLLYAAQGLTRLVTLAPECDQNSDTIRFLSDQNITISAGHCNPSMDQLKDAIDAGLSMFTHLGNGCPMQMHRHDNIIQRVLALRDQLDICFIPDGVHVDFTALKNFIDLVGMDRTIVVTDAIAPAGLGPGRYTLGRWQLDIADDMVARAPDGSHLVGSAITMPQIENNLATQLDFDKELIQLVTCDNPKRAIGL